MAHSYVNIGMVTYNRLEFTRRSIRSVVENTGYPYRLTVVDNGSTDGTCQYLRELKQKKQVHNLCLLPGNVGVAKAANIAWRQEPAAAYYLKLDNDIVIRKRDWLKHMVETIEKIPFLGIVAYNFEPVSYPLRDVEGTSIRCKEKSIGGCCTLVPNRTERILGHWCEDYGLYGEEDSDYSERVRLLGYWNAYMPDEEIGIHLPAGRAAHIETGNYTAADGEEEIRHKEYREFKDKERAGNYKQNIVENNITDYRQFKKPFFFDSQRINEKKVSQAPTGTEPWSEEVYRYVRRYEAAHQKGDIEKALHNLTEARNRFPNDVWFHIREAAIQYETGQYENARRRLKEAVYQHRQQMLEEKEKSKIPWIAEEYIKQAELYNENRDHAAAKEWLDRAAKAGEETGHRLEPINMYRLASLYKQQGHNQTAQKWYEEVLRQADHKELHAGANYHLGEIYYYREQPGSAAECFARTLELNPHHQKAARYRQQIKTASEKK